MTEQTNLKWVSLFWENDSDELLEMMRELREPGITVGNDGCELAVTDSEYAEIMEYVEAHSEITVELHGEITVEEAAGLEKEMMS